MYGGCFDSGGGHFFVDTGAGLKSGLSILTGVHDVGHAGA